MKLTIDIQGTTVADIAKELTALAAQFVTTAKVLEAAPAAPVAAPTEAKAPAKATRARKAPKVEEESFALDGETDADAETDETEAEETETVPSEKDLQQALAAYAKKHGQAKALVKLQKFAKHVAKVPADQRAALIASL